MSAIGKGLEIADVIKDLMLARDARVIQLDYEGGVRPVEIRYMEFSNGERPFENPYDKRVKFCEVVFEPLAESRPN